MKREKKSAHENGLNLKGPRGDVGYTEAEESEKKKRRLKRNSQ